jgi:hypothetical protein
LKVRAVLSWHFLESLTLGYRVTPAGAPNLVADRGTCSVAEVAIGGYSTVSGISSASSSNALRISVWPAASHPRAVQDRNHHRRFNFDNLDQCRHRQSIDQSSDRGSDRRLELG